MDGDIGLSVFSTSQGCGPLLPDPLRNHLPMRQRIFEHVRAHGHAARADICRALGISAGSATTLTAELIRNGLLREVDLPTREQGRGRPPVALQIVPEAGFVVGIKLSNDRNTATLSDFSGAVIASEVTNTQSGKRTLDCTLDQMGVLIEQLLTTVGKVASDIAAVGIGMAGVIDHATGTVRWSPLLDGLDQHFSAAFARRFGLPLYLENDANMLTLAELWFGAGRAIPDFAVVTVEDGVGMGLVLGGQLYRGAWGMGLELGHTKVQLDGALCRCGERGCLEAYLADYALVREALTALEIPSGPDASVLSVLYKQAQGGNPAARAVFARAGKYLSLGLSNVVQLFDPALIILSCRRMDHDFITAPGLIADVKRLTLARGQTPCQIEIRPWGDLSWARGATARALASVTDTLFSAEAR